MFAIHGTGILWLKHNGAYKDLILKTNVDFGFNRLDGINQLPNCFVGARPLKGLLIANPDTNCIESFEV
jgi:hypothetical protein